MSNQLPAINPNLGLEAIRRTDSGRVHMPGKSDMPVVGSRRTNHVRENFDVSSSLNAMLSLMQSDMDNHELTPRAFSAGVLDAAEKIVADPSAPPETEAYMQSLKSMHQALLDGIHGVQRA